MSRIHPSAIIEDGAQIGQDCVIGPFCHVGPQVRLGDRVELKSHVVVTGETSIGDDCVRGDRGSPRHSSSQCARPDESCL